MIYKVYYINGRLLRGESLALIEYFMGLSNKFVLNFVYSSGHTVDLQLLKVIPSKWKTAEFSIIRETKVIVFREFKNLISINIVIV